MRAQLGDRLPTFTEAEFALLREAELDFYGMNYYTSQFARHRTSPASDTDYIGNVDEFPENKAGVSIGELSGIRWLRSAPQGFRKHLVRIYKKYGKPIYVTENGCPCPGEDKMSKEESLKDVFRQRYFSDHFDAIIGATQDGAKVAGYFAWSLIDNLGKFPQTHGPSSCLRTKDGSDLVLLDTDLASRMVRGVRYQVRGDVHRLRHTREDAQGVGIEDSRHDYG